MALSANEPVDLFAQRRLDALAKTRDTARARASDAAAQRFSLEDQAAARRQRQGTEAARTARADAADRTSEKPAAPKPAPIATERKTTATAEKTPAPRRPEAPAAGKAAAKPASAPTSPPVKPPANPASDATATQAATAGEAQATLASSVDGLDDDAEDAETKTTESSGETAPTLLILGPPPTSSATRPNAASAATGDGSASAIAAKVSGAAAGIGIEGPSPDGKDGDHGDAEAESGFKAALGDAGAPATPADPSLARGGPSATTAASHAAAAGAPAQPASQPVPIGQVPLTIGLRSLNGSNQFEIRLDPLELGRIDVKLDIDKDSGTVATRIVVERPETLALLQRDAGQLQQALTQAGLDPSAGGIDLSLRGDGANGGADTGQKDGQARGPRQPFTDTTDARATLDAVPLRSLRGIGSLDIRI